MYFMYFNVFLFICFTPHITKTCSIYAKPCTKSVLFVCLFLYALHHTPAKHLVFMPHPVKKILFLQLAIASGRTEVFGEDILFFRECFIRQQNVHTSVICDANYIVWPNSQYEKKLFSEFIWYQCSQEIVISTIIVISWDLLSDPCVSVITQKISVHILVHKHLVGSCICCTSSDCINIFLIRLLCLKSWVLAIWTYPGLCSSISQTDDLTIHVFPP